MNIARKEGIQSTAGAKIGSGAPPVKPFSHRFRLIGGFILFYSGWFFANAVLHLAPGTCDLTVPAGHEASALLWVLASVLLIVGFAAGAWVFAGGGLGFESAGRSISADALDAGEALFKIAAFALGLVLIALHIKVCVVERVEVAGNSMYPTLKNGEVIWIEKLSTGLHVPDLSFPFGGLTPTGKLPEYGLANIDRGDVVVFRYPGVSEDQNDYYIKRVIALPGEEYEIAGGRVYLNGQELPEPYLPTSTLTRAQPRYDQPAVYPLPLELNLLPADVRQSALFGAGRRGRVPPHTILVMGDNRELSRDSRSIGFIPVFFILGVALAE